MSRFFYCVIVPSRGISKLEGTEILSGRLMALNAFEANRIVEKLHPDAFEIQVCKHKEKAIAQ